MRRRRPGAPGRRTARSEMAARNSSVYSPGSTRNRRRFDAAQFPRTPRRASRRRGRQARAGSLIVRTQRGDDVPVARRDGGGGGAQPFERSERLGQPAHETGGEIERRFAEVGPRIRRVQVGTTLRRSFMSSARKPPSACASPTLPGRGRGPRSTAFSSAATARMWAPVWAPSRISGCLSKASRLAGAGPPSATSAASRANTPALVSANALPLGSSTRTCQRSSAGGDAARQCAVGRDQGRGLALRLGRLAQAAAMDSASSSALAASMTESLSSAASISAWDRRAVASGRWRRPDAGPRRRSARACSRCGQRHDLLAGDADAAQQRLHGELRMADCRRDGFAAALGTAADQVPGLASSSRSRPGSTTAPCGISRWWRSAPRLRASSRSSRRR